MALFGEPRAAGTQRRRASSAGRAAFNAAVRRRRALGGGQRRSRDAAHAPAARPRRRDAVPPGRRVRRGVCRADGRSAPGRGRPRRRAEGRARRDPGGGRRRKRREGSASTAAVRGRRRGCKARGDPCLRGIRRRFFDKKSNPRRARFGFGFARGRRARPGRRVRVRGVAASRVRRHLAVLCSGGGVALARRVGHGLGARAEGLPPDGGVRRGR